MLLRRLVRARPILARRRRGVRPSEMLLVLTITAQPQPRQQEITPEGRQATHLEQILLNGNNIALLVPGGAPDDE